MCLFAFLLRFRLMPLQCSMKLQIMAFRWEWAVWCRQVKLAAPLKSRVEVGVRVIGYVLFLSQEQWVSEQATIHKKIWKSLQSKVKCHIFLFPLVLPGSHLVWCRTNPWSSGRPAERRSWSGSQDSDELGSGCSPRWFVWWITPQEAKTHIGTLD